jgi:hypothetical protein
LPVAIAPALRLAIRNICSWIAICNSRTVTPHCGSFSYSARAQSSRIDLPDGGRPCLDVSTRGRIPKMPHFGRMLDTLLSLGIRMIPADYDWGKSQ